MNSLYYKGSLDEMFQMTSFHLQRSLPQRWNLGCIKRFHTVFSQFSILPLEYHRTNLFHHWEEVKRKVSCTLFKAIKMGTYGREEFQSEIYLCFYQLTLISQVMHQFQTKLYFNLNFFTMMCKPRTD